MLYQLYETQRALLSPFSEFASASSKLYSHPLTDKGLAAFVEDWKKTGQSIL